MASSKKAFKAFNLVLEAWGDSEHMVHPEWMAVTMGQEQVLNLLKVGGAAKNWESMLTTVPGLKKPHCVEFDASVGPVDAKWVVIENGASVMGNITPSGYAVTADGVQFIGEMKQGLVDFDECLSWPLNLEELQAALDNRVEGALQGKLLWVTPDTLVASSLVGSETIEELQEQAALVLSIVSQKALSAA